MTCVSTVCVCECVRTTRTCSHKPKATSTRAQKYFEHCNEIIFLQHAIVAVAAFFSPSLLPLFVCAALLNDITCSNINMTGSKARQGEQTTTCTTNGNRMCWLGSCEVMFRPGQRLHTYVLRRLLVYLLNVRNLPIGIIECHVLCLANGRLQVTMLRVCVYVVVMGPRAVLT